TSTEQPSTTQTSTEQPSTSETGTTPDHAPAATPEWTVEGGTATLTAAPGTTIEGTIRYDAATGQVQFVSADGSIAAVDAAGLTAVSLSGGSGNDRIAIDRSVGAMPAVLTVTGGGGSDTLEGPAVDSNWFITGADSGTVGDVAFSGFGHLVGAADNEDTFVLAPGGATSGVIEGGAAGFDSLVVDGLRSRVVSNPTNAHSGTLIVDGVAISYVGLEPITISAAVVTINGSDSALSLGDLLRVSPGAGSTVRVENFDSIVTTLALSESHVVTILGLLSLTINGGEGTDTVEFVGDYLVPGTNLTVNAEKIKVRSGTTIDVGTGNIAFNATAKDNGVSLVGVTSTVLGVEGSIEIDGATVTGNVIDLKAFAGTLATTVNGAGQVLGGGMLNVVSTLGFASGGGKFTVSGATGTCSYTGKTATSFTGISVCTGTPDNAASVRWDITENGSGTGINHAVVQLIYTAAVNIHGASTITATGGDVTLDSTVDVTASANALGGPDRGNWVSGTAYTEGDVVTDPTDSKRYAAKNDITISTTAPSGDAPNWEDAINKDSSVAATLLVASATSQLSGTSVISAARGSVTISSTMTTYVNTAADSSASGSGAGIAVGVVVTKSEAFVDSTAATPITAQNLAVTADTDNSAPTTGTSSPRGAKGANDQPGNSPTRTPEQTAAAGGKADGQSKTVDGNQDLSAALAVTVLVASTKAYISPTDPASVHAITTTGGSQKIRARAKNKASAVAKAGNVVRLSPGAPTFISSATTGGFLADETIYYYRVSAVFAGGGESLPGPTGQYAVPSGTDANQVTLSWTAVDGATGYKIYRGTTSGGELLLASLGAVTTYVDDTDATPAGAMPTTDTISGVGIAVAVNVVAVTTKAWLAGNALLTANTVTVEALATSVSEFLAKSTSGAGGTSVGVAGSIAVNVAVSDTTATVATPAPVAVTGDLSLTATSNLDNQAHALAKQSSDGKATGVGASLGLNIVNDSTSAGLTDDSVLTGADDLTITATTTGAMTTTAEGGASAGAGSTAISAQVAISVSNATTTASVGTGSVLVLAGALTATANQTETVTTEAKGQAAGGTAAGMALAMTFAAHSASALVERDVQAGGAITLSAVSNSTTSTKATASAAGAPEAATGQTVDGDVQRQRGFASQRTVETTPGTASDQAAGSASTSDGAISVAAAVALNIASANTAAGLATGVLVTAPGMAVILTSTANRSNSAEANGSAVSPTGDGVGAAIAINVGTGGSETPLPADSSLIAGSLSGSVGSTNTNDAKAISGAGAGDVGVAGSLAINIVNVSTKSVYEANSSRGPPAITGTVALSATSTVTSTTEALPAVTGVGVTAENFGLGASVALAIINVSTVAGIADGAVLPRSAAVTLTADTRTTTTTTARNGAKATAAGSTAVTPVVAVTISNVLSSARIGALLGGNLDVVADIGVRSELVASVITTAEGSSQAIADAVGVAIALTYANHRAVATSLRNLLAGGNVTFEAVGASGTSSVAVASAAGAPGEDTAGAPAGGVDGQILAERSLADQAAVSSGTGNSSVVPPSPAAESSEKDGAGNSTPLQVAAAIAVTVAISTQDASLPAGIVVGSSVAPIGVLTLRASGNSDSSASASGQSVTTGAATGDTVGAAVGLNLAFATTTAGLGAGSQVFATGLTVQAMTNARDADGDPATAMDDSNTFGAEATSGAGGGKNSVAGSLAFNLVLASASAQVGAGSTVTLSGA
ncbi:MAG: hypothetical protein LH624_01545, partial [Cryobacterium sp.]|nr:hypothetical protein [Cryobacterium sp.]